MDLRHTLPYMSKSALQAIIEYAQHTDMSELPSSRRAITRSAADASPSTPYGEMLTQAAVVGTTPGDNKTMIVVNPFAYLWHVFGQGGGFYRMYKQVLSEHKCSLDNPLHLALYGDEIVVGNALAAQNNRKVWALYFSSTELGLHLHSEDAWIPLAIEPAEGLKHVSGGISQFFAICLRQFFGDCIHDISQGGLRLLGPDGDAYRIWALMHLFIMDGAAHKLLWGCRGDGGMRMCMLCLNVVTKKSAVKDADNKNLLVCEHVSEDQLQLASGSGIRGTLDRLAAHQRTHSRADLKLTEMASGFSIVPHGILDDKKLVQHVFPAEQYAHDWMHGTLSNGVGNVVMYLALDAMSNHIDNLWDHVSDYCKSWHFPARPPFNPITADVFSQKRLKAYRQAKSIKCPASHLCSIFNVLACFVEFSVPSNHPVLSPARLAFLSLWEVIESLQTSPLGVTTPDELSARIDTFLRAFKNAGWDDHMIPKFHWLLHAPSELRRFGVALACFVHERKHRMVKRFGTDILNIKALSYSMLSEVMVHQIWSVTDPEAFDTSLRLIKPHRASRGLERLVMSELRLSNAIVMSALTAFVPPLTVCTVADVVLFLAADKVNYNAGVVKAFVELEEYGKFCVLSMLSLLEQRSESCTEWRVTDDLLLLDLSLVLAPVVWTELRAAVYRLIVPRQFRGLKAVAA